MAASARKAITVVIVDAMTGPAMRTAARSAATTGVSPRCRTRKSACSPTTMESSTITPSTRISANSEIMLIVKPPVHITKTAAKVATGMPAATQSAMRPFRNRNSISTTSTSPVAALSNISDSRSVICSARVRTRSSVTPCGRAGRIAAATSATRACMSMASPSGPRSTRIAMAGFSPTKAARPRSAPSTRTLATSRMRSTVPSAATRRAISPISSARRRSSPVRTRAAPVATSPAGEVTTAAAMASAISAMVTSCRISATEVTSTTVCGADNPLIVVRVTPAAKSRAVNSSASRAS